METEKTQVKEELESEEEELVLKLTNSEDESGENETIDNIKKFIEETTKPNTKNRTFIQSYVKKLSNESPRKSSTTSPRESPKKSLSESPKKSPSKNMKNLVNDLQDNATTAVKELSSREENTSDEIIDEENIKLENFETIKVVCEDGSDYDLVIMIDEAEGMKVEEDTDEAEENEGQSSDTEGLLETDSHFLCSKCNVEYPTVEDFAKHYKQKHYNPQEHDATSRVVIPSSKPKKRKKSTTENNSEYSADEKENEEIIVKVKPLNRKKTLKKSGEAKDVTNKKSRFRCNRCLSSFFTYEELKEHRESGEHSHPVLCTVCKKSFKYKYLLHLHMKNHIPSNTRIYHMYKCLLCKAECNTFHKFYLHAEEDHPDAKTCLLCSKRFPYRFGMKNHLKAHRKRFYRCLSCEKMFRGNNELKKHYHSKEHLATKTCRQCNKVFGTPYKMREHIVLRHSTDKPHQCEYCGKIFTMITSLNRHKLKEHLKSQDFTYICEHCGKAFKTKKSLYLHTQIHFKTQYACCLCAKMCTSEEDLSDHLKIHKEQLESLNSVITQCPKCNLKSEDFQELFKHYLNEHFLYLCYKCGFYFEKRRSFDFHLQTHNDMSNIEFTNGGVRCTTCHRVFKYKSSLRYHMYIHTGEKPYECKVCHRKFRKPYHIKHHMRIHSDVRTYECYICHEKFGSRDDLVAHRQIHINQVACNVCKKEFNSEKSCERHVIYQHGVQEQEVADSIVKGTNKPHEIKKNQPKLEYHCKYCIRVFKSSPACDNHMKRYHPQKRNDIEEMDIKEYLDPRRKDCLFCHRYFKSDQAYSNHMKRAHPKMLYGDDPVQIPRRKKVEDSEEDTDDPLSLNSEAETEVEHKKEKPSPVSIKSEKKYKSDSGKANRDPERNVQYIETEDGQLYELGEGVECVEAVDGVQMLEGFELEEGVEYRIVQEDEEGNIVIQEEEENVQYAIISTD